MTLDAFWAGYEDARPIFDTLQRELGALGAEMHVTKSQVAFRRRRAFAWAWTPQRYLRGDHAPLVLSLALPYRSDSPRWKEVVEPAPGRWMHHLELSTGADLNDEVRRWLREAWRAAG